MHQHRSLVSTCPLLLIVGLLPFSISVAMASQLEEILVTADLLDPSGERVSVTVINAEQIEQRAAIHLEDLLSAAPNITVASGASRGRFFQIRGVGERSQFVEPVNASVGMSLDGVDMTGLGAAATVYDMAQVEILRGPQGTLYGANALAGLINLHSNRADAGDVAKINAGIESNDGYRAGIVLGGALNEQWSARLAGQTTESDGNYHNRWLNRQDTNARDETSVKGLLAWQSNEQRLELGIYHIAIDNGYDAFSLDNTRDTLSDQPGRDQLNTHAIRLNWQRSGQVVDWTTQLSSASSDTDYSYDEDWSYVGIAPGWEYSSFDRYQRDRDMLSAELRANSSANSGANHNATLSWVAGIYLRREQEDLRRDYTYLESPFSSALTIQTHALFGQVDWSLSTSLSAFAGLRLEQRDSDYNDSATVDEAFDDTLWSGKIGVQWQLSDTHNTYLSIARGVRGGGVNAGLLASIGTFETPTDLRQFGFFDAESLHSFELGWQYTDSDKGLQSRLAIFMMSRDDQQAKGSLTFPRSDGSTAFIDYTDNATKGSTSGVEWEAAWQLTGEVQISGALGLINAEFDRYTTANGEDLSGREQPHAPSWQYRIAGDWQVDTAWSLGLEMTAMDSFYFSDRHDTRSPKRTLLNGYIRWQRDSWQLQLWGRNLTDENYYNRGFGSFGNDPRKEYAVEPYYQFGEPRIIGLTAQYNLN